MYQTSLYLMWGKSVCSKLKRTSIHSKMRIEGYQWKLFWEISIILTWKSILDTSHHLILFVFRSQRFTFNWKSTKSCQTISNLKFNYINITLLSISPTEMLQILQTGSKTPPKRFLESRLFLRLIKFATTNRLIRNEVVIFGIVNR